MAGRLPELTSGDEFVRLRTSADPQEYERAARAEMPLAVWWELVRQYPDMRFRAAHSKCVPAAKRPRLRRSGSARRVWFDLDSWPAWRPAMV